MQNSLAGGYARGPRHAKKAPTATVRGRARVGSTARLRSLPESANGEQFEIMIGVPDPVARGHVRRPPGAAPELRARARFEHSSGSRGGLGGRPRHAEKGPPRGQFASQPNGGVMFYGRNVPPEPHWELPELAPLRAIRGQFASQPPLLLAASPPLAPSTRAASPDRGGRLGAQFEAQGRVRARCCRSHDQRRSSMSRNVASGRYGNSETTALSGTV